MNEECTEFYIGDTYLGDVNHDEHGWSGMASAKDLLLKMAKELGINVILKEGE